MSRFDKESESRGMVETAVDTDPLLGERPSLGARLKAFFREQWLILLLTGLVIVFGTVNRVLYKIITVPMQHYSYFLANFNSVCYTLLYFSILFVRYRMKIVTWDMLQHPKWKFILIGCMDSLGSVLGLIGAAHISGPLIVMLPNGTILFTIIVSMIILRSRYNILQLLAATLILGGVFVTIVPKIIDPDFEVGELGFYLIYFFSTAPNAVSFCVKELVFRHRKDLDIFVVNSFGSMFQLCFTLLFLPIVSIPGFGGIPYQKLGYYFIAAAYCFAGINPTVDDNCYGSPVAPIIYICVNLTWNICLLLLLKKGGAFYMFIAITASLPIAENLFNVDWPLLKATPFSWWHIGGLVVILSGIISYRIFTIRKERREREAEERRRQLAEVNASLDMPERKECCPCITTDCC